MSPWMMLKFGYFSEREESLEGVRARTLTLKPAARERVSVARPVPPVAPKIAIVFVVVDDMPRFGCIFVGEGSMFELV